MGRRTVTTVVFDFGGVVVDWNMRHLFGQVFDSADEMETFLAEVLTPAENLRCDLGPPLAEVVADLADRHPEHRLPLEAWRDRWIETIPGEIAGTAQLIDDLLDQSYRVLGLSNFSSETFPWCRERFEVFDRFEDIVISGEAGVAKPDPQIYELLCERNGIEPADAVFLDDSIVNVDGALAIGMAAFHFTDAQQARRDLARLGVLGGEA